MAHIYQLHANDLPLRHLLKHFDGGTTDHIEYSGPTGKMLEKCEQLLIVLFNSNVYNLREAAVDVSAERSIFMTFMKQFLQTTGLWICPNDILENCLIPAG